MAIEMLIDIQRVDGKRDAYGRSSSFYYEARSLPSGVRVRNVNPFDYEILLGVTFLDEQVYALKRGKEKLESGGGLRW